MTLSERIHRFRRYRKMKRDKPHYWHLPHLKLGWIQNYKVGTNSIKQSLACNIREHENPDQDCPSLTEDEVAVLGKKYAEFLRPKQIRERYSDDYIFAFVRNPLDRLYSSFANKVLDIRGTEKLSPFRQYGITTESTFEEFVHAVADIPDGQADRHFRAQHWFVSHEDKLITDYIGKLENFSEDWTPLGEKFGLRPPPHKNQSSLQKSHYASFYTKEIWEIALKRYEKDIETFDYGEILLADQPS